MGDTEKYKLMKDLVKRSIYFLFNFKHKQGDKKNIMLFSTRRGGSTWLTEILSVNEGIRFIDHAFGYLNADWKGKKYLPKTFFYQYIDKDQRLLNYLDLIENHNLIVRTQWNPFALDFQRVSNRIVYKITEAKALIDWFDSLNKYEIIYQIRHPIPTAMSLLRRGGPLTVEAYVKNESFRKKYLNNDLYDFCNNILHGQNELNKYILGWVLENLTPLRSRNIKKWFVVSYEEMVLQPKNYIDYFANVLNLSQKDKMKKMITEPSKSSNMTTKETREKINKNETNFLISKWKKDISHDQEKEAMGILEKFELDVYKFNELLPDKKYLRFL